MENFLRFVIRWSALKNVTLQFLGQMHNGNSKLALKYSFIFQEVDLIPNGSKIEVTNQNKMKYLDALAQYKLHTRVSAEIESFVKGMTALIRS